VLEMADRAVVLRDGRKVADQQRKTLDHDQLIAHVTGVAKGVALAGQSNREKGASILEISGLSGAGVESVDLILHAGEVVGVAGVLGSGREALPALMFGAIDSTAHHFVLGGQQYRKRRPAESIRRGMAFVAGDRARFGAVRALTARENITLPELASLRSRFGGINRKKERAHASALMDQFGVRPPLLEQKFSQFSGGNQQKIVMAKWLRNRPQVLLLEEPTQGVDIGAKQAIYTAIESAAEQGAAVLVCSSDAKELVRLCDRVLVLRNGTVAAELSGDRLTETNLVLAGYGLADADAEPVPPPTAGATRDMSKGKQ
jgi:ribose transport system ATP-binding protein